MANTVIPIQAPLFREDDFKPENKYGFFNQWATQVTNAANLANGAVGPSVLPSGVDMQGGRITGLAAPQHNSDAISAGHADKAFSAESLQPQLDIGGKSQLKGLGSLYLWQQTAIPQIVAIQDQLSVGISGTVTLAKITGGGTSGSITFVKGIITAFTPPT